MSFPQLTSIELLAVDLEDLLISADDNHTDDMVLHWTFHGSQG